MSHRASLARLWVLMVTAFVDMIGYAMILPLFPLFAQDFDIAETAIGGLLAAFALAQLITAPLWGKLSDRIGRRPVILTGQLLAAIAYLVFALATVQHGTNAGASAFLLLLASRLAQGAGGGTIAVNQAYVADAIEPDRRAQALGWITACSSAGVMIGPAIASFSVRWSHAAPGLIAAGMCLLSAAFAWRWLPESKGEAGPRPSPRRLRTAIADVLRRPLLPAHSLIVVYAGGMLGFMAMSAMMSLYLADAFGITKETIGGFFVFIGFLSIVMRAVILGPLVRRLGEVRVLRYGLLALACGLGLPPLATTPWLFLAAVGFVPVGTALLFPTTTSLVSRFAEKEELGQTHGVQQAFGGLSRLLAPLGAGAAYQYLGRDAPFLIAAGLVLATGAVALRLRPGDAPRQPEPAVAEAA